LQKKIDYKPDLLVGLSRGGLVPLRLLSDILGINSVGVLGLSLYKGIGKTFDKPKIVQDLAIDITGKKILIIDDVADSGRSLVAAKAYFEGKGAKEIKIATLHYKPNSIFKPDYFVATTTAWIGKASVHRQARWKERDRTQRICSCCGTQQKQLRSQHSTLPKTTRDKRAYFWHDKTTMESVLHQPARIRKSEWRTGTHYDGLQYEAE